MNMKLLQGTLPDCVTVDGASYPVYTDFRNWIRLEDVLFGGENSFLTKLASILPLCYRELPPTLDAAIRGILSFYACGETGRQGGTTGRPSYSFVQDEALIYAAFYQQYGIDLSVAELHWWQFCALLSGLGEDTLLSRVIGFRTVDIQTVKNAEEKQFYRRMKALYKLKDTRSDAEREADAYAALEKLF